MYAGRGGREGRRGWRGGGDAFLRRASKSAGEKEDDEEGQRTHGENRQLRSCRCNMERRPKKPMLSNAPCSRKALAAAQHPAAASSPPILIHPPSFPLLLDGKKYIPAEVKIAAKGSCVGCGVESREGGGEFLRKGARRRREKVKRKKRRESRRRRDATKPLVRVGRPAAAKQRRGEERESRENERKLR